MKLYKLFLCIAVLLLIALFFYPRVSAKAEEPVKMLPSAQNAPITQQVLQYANYYDVSGKLALAIATCESRLKPNARNKTSSAKGIYQWIDGSWAMYSKVKWGVVKDVFDASANIELAVWVISEKGTSDWNASKECWKENALT